MTGINGNTYGGLRSAWWFIRCDIERRRGRDTCGKKSAAPSSKHSFYAKAARYLALLDGRSSSDPRVRVEDRTAADLWERVAFLQAVKCSHKGGVGRPGDEMVENCPTEYLRAELERLEPRVLLVMGKRVWWSVAAALGVEGPRGAVLASHAISDRARLGREVNVYFVVHPRAKEFTGSVEKLMALRGRSDSGVGRRHTAGNDDDAS